jgi:Ger(x)C family germination protein
MDTFISLILKRAALIALFMLLSGCWDQSLLSGAVIQLAYGIDIADKGKINSSFYLVSGENKTQIISMTGDTPRDTRLHANQRLPGNVDSSKNRVVLISEEAAKKGIYPYLDVLYRDPKSSLNAKIGITESAAEQVLQAFSNSPNKLAIDKIFTSMEYSTSVPNVNVQDICTTMFDDGRDTIMPYVSLDKENRVVVSGSALFHKEFYKGKMTKDDTELLLIMKNELAKTAQFRVHLDEIPGIRGFATSNAIQVKSKMKVKLKDGKANTSLRTKIRLEIIEFPDDKLADPERIKKIETLYEKELTKQMSQVFKQLQKANCDALGIARHIQAFYSSEWKQMDWENDYAQVQLEPHVDVEITGTGIIE